ncbi:MAG: efflux RND transporter permease subunit, partial [Propionibacteriaceae bacterium]|nr:efflux RND transporter permease subunit [Propionibacteriaceae bacterium]
TDEWRILRLADPCLDGAGAVADTAAAAAAVLVPRLRDLPGVRAVDVSGYTADVITITPDAAAMAFYGVTLAQLTALLRDNGLTVPLGAVDQAGKTISVQIGEPVTTIDALRAIPLSIYQPPPPESEAPPPDGEAPPPAGEAPPPEGEAPPPEPPVVITLDAVACVAQAPAPADSHVRLDGVNAVEIAVVKTPAADAVDVAAAVDAVLAEVAGALAGRGCVVSVADSQALFIEESVAALATEGLVGLVACVVVILLFLLSLRVTLVAAVSIPLSVLATLVGLRAVGGTLNVLTIGAIAIAVGRGVDGSIAVAESIRRHLSPGAAKLPAITAGVREVAGAVTATTVGAAAIFLPVAFVTGLTGELFGAFAWTAGLALLCSLAVALTIVPALAYWFVKPAAGAAAAGRPREAAAAQDRRPLQRGYRRVLRGALAHPAATLCLAAVILAGTAWAGRSLETDFFDVSSQNTVTVTLAFPVDTALAVQDEGARQVEDRLGQLRGEGGLVQTVRTTVGADGPLAGRNAVGQPTVAFAVTVAGQPAAAAAAPIRELLADLDGVVGSIEVAAASPVVGATAIDLIIRSDDTAHLGAAAAAVEAMVSGLPGVAAVDYSLAASQELYEIRVDRARALGFGLTEAQIAATVAALTQPATLGAVNDGGTTVTVALAQGAAASTLEQLMGLPVGTSPDGAVLLGQVATAFPVDAPAALTTSQGKRSATVSVTPAGAGFGSLAAAIRDGLADLDPHGSCDPMTAVCLPEEATVEVGGLAGLQADAFAGLGWALLIAVALVYLVMVAVLGSLLQPLVLLLAVLFAAPGACVALLAGGGSVGVAALVGLLMLVGVAASSGLLFADLANRHRRAGRPLSRAIEDGACQRLRPTLAAAAATVAALLPLSLGLTGHPPLLPQPVALVVIGGLVSATLFTLLAVPVLYRFEALAHDRRTARQTATAARRRHHPDGWPGATPDRLSRRAARAVGPGSTSAAADQAAKTPVSAASPTHRARNGGDSTGGTVPTGRAFAAPSLAVKTGPFLGQAGYVRSAASPVDEWTALG